MRKWFAVLVSVAVIAGACGGGDDSANDPATASTPPPASEQQEDGGDSASSGEANTDSGSGTLENPTPEASGQLPPDSFRIGNNVWARTIPMTRGQCFVQEGEGVAPFTAWGTLDNDDNLEYSVSYNADTDSSDAQVTSDSMFWVAGSRDGSELAVEDDFATQSISGTGLFYNMHSDEWAYGSFQFTCTG